MVNVQPPWTPIGLSLYQASAVVLRTSLTTLYSDCHVELTRTNVVSSGRRERKAQIALCMVGQNRVSGARAEWNVCVFVLFVFVLSCLL